MKPLTYLASPYSVGNATAEERVRRYKEACRTAAILMKRGEKVFSPIAHSHSIEIDGDFGAVEGHDFWLEQDFAVLGRCTKVKVLNLDGVDITKSIGINAELVLAKSMGIPIVNIDREGVCLVS